MHWIRVKVAALVLVSIKPQGVSFCLCSLLPCFCPPWLLFERWGKRGVREEPGVHSSIQMCQQQWPCSLQALPSNTAAHPFSLGCTYFADVRWWRPVASAWNPELYIAMVPCCALLWCRAAHCYGAMLQAAPAEHPVLHVAAACKGPRFREQHCRSWPTMAKCKYYKWAIVPCRESSTAAAGQPWQNANTTNEQLSPVERAALPQLAKLGKMQLLQMSIDSCPACATLSSTTAYGAQHQCGKPSCMPTSIAVLNVHPCAHVHAPPSSCAGRAAAGSRGVAAEHQAAVPQPKR